MKKTLLLSIVLILSTFVLSACFERSYKDRVVTQYNYLTIFDEENDLTEEEQDILDLISFKYYITLPNAMFGKTIGELIEEGRPLYEEAHKQVLEEKQKSTKLDNIDDELFQIVSDNNRSYTNENGTTYKLDNYYSVEEATLDVKYTKNNSLKFASKRDIEVNILKGSYSSEAIIELKNKSNKYALVRGVSVTTDRDLDSKYGSRFSSPWLYTYTTANTSWYSTLYDNPISYFYIRPNSSVYYVYKSIYLDFDISELSKDNINIDLFDGDLNKKPDTSLDSPTRYDDYFNYIILDNISTDVRQVDDELAITFTNNNEEYLNLVRFQVVYYKNGNVVYVDDHYATPVNYAKNGDSIYVNVLLARNILSDSVIDFDNYEINIFSACTYKEIRYPSGKELNVELLNIIDLSGDNIYDLIFKITNPLPINFEIEETYPLIMENGEFLTMPHDTQNVTIMANSYVYCDDFLIKKDGIDYGSIMEKEPPEILFSYVPDIDLIVSPDKKAKDEHYSISSVRSGDNEIIITVSNNSSIKKIKNISIGIAYFKDNEIIAVDNTLKTAYNRDFEGIAPNEEYQIVKECTYAYSKPDDFIDFDDYEIYVTEIQREK